ncbi:MAG: hypothetical protein VYE22_02045 [Myxococcota bacterium]|nr:hypothetical protein [Myxococcota bacterium]
MGIDVSVQPLAMAWAGLDDASLDALVDRASYARPGEQAPPRVIRSDARPEYPEELTAAQRRSAEAAVRRLQRMLGDAAGAPVSWSEELPDPNDVEAWEEEEGYLGKLAPDGLDEMRGIAAALSSGVEPGSLERLLNASSDALTRRVWSEGGGRYPQVLSLGIATVFVHAPLPHPLVGADHILGSIDALGTELERFAEEVFGAPLGSLIDEPPFGGGLRDAILANLELLVEALEEAADRRLPIVVSG